MPPTSETLPAFDLPLIVQSHLRWDFVWQRPQQLLSRVARTQSVLFVEEPIIDADAAYCRLDLSQPHPGVYRAVPYLTRDFRVDDHALIRTRELITNVIGRGGPLAGRFDRPAQWFYSPMSAPVMLGAFHERVVIYDCMDELARFRYAPADIAHRERGLLRDADIVFAGGQQLYCAKSRLHRNVHFFGCGVDAAHFGQAALAETRIPDDARIAGQVLGYIGVIDERLDYALLERLADEIPAATVMMVGPVAKIDANELPRRANIRWLGQRDYAALPGYLKAFDVCLMPFALNEATQYINPTKTLEYMAAGKPIVSTPVADVVRQFADIVRVAPAGTHFVDAVREALATPDARRVEAGVRRGADASWDAIVSQMRHLIADVIAKRDWQTVAHHTHHELLRAASRLAHGAPLLVDDAGVAPAA
jgi:glycosyltransferase involved in cell wall biosynthesis